MRLLIKYISIVLLLMYSYFSKAQVVWSLDECISIAHENNLEVKSKHIDNGKALVDVKIAKNEFLPDLNAYTNFYAKFGQGQDVFGTSRRNDNLNSDIGLNSNMLLYNHGRLKKEVNQARLLLQISEQELSIIKRNIAKSVVEAYLLVQLNMEYVRTADSSANYASIQYNNAKMTTEVGTTAQSVAYEAKANWDTEKLKLLNVRQELMRSKIKLSQIMMIDDLDSFNVDNPSNTIDVYLISLNNANEKLLENAFENDPVLNRLKLVENSLNLNGDIIRTSLYPTVKAGVSIGSFYFNSLTSSSNENLSFQIKNNFAQQVGLSISIPIFNKNRVKNGVKKNSLEIEKIQVEVTNQKLAINQDFNKLIYDLNAFKEQYRMAADVVLSVKKAMEFTRKSYEAGRSTIYDLNSSNKNYLLAESEMIRAKYNCFFSIQLLELLINGNVTTKY